jgi:hypothetical protein
MEKSAPSQMLARRLPWLRSVDRPLKTIPRQKARSDVMDKAEKSVAEALGRAHAALLKDLRALELAGRPDSKNGPNALRARLDATRAHLVEHFRFEEQSGYMDAVRKREPRLERAVEQLAEQHRELLGSLDALIREIGTAPSIDASVGAKITAWVKNVQQHEARENHLVQEAFSLDIGAED